MGVVSSPEAAFFSGKCDAPPITSNIPLSQILHAFLFNIRNYSPEVNNIQQRAVELNVSLSRIKYFDIEQKRYGIFVLLYIPRKYIPTENNWKFCGTLRIIYLDVKVKGI